MRLKTIAEALLLEAVLVGGVALFSHTVRAQTETPVPTNSGTPPTMTAIQPVNPVSSKPGGPVIQSITAHLPPGTDARAANTIIPEFHFIAPNGNAVLLHREVVKTDANHINLNPSSPINIPEEAQKAGAVASGGWNCGTAQFYVTLSAWIMDADGNKSNTVQFTVHCNGG